MVNTVSKGFKAKAYLWYIL